MSEPAPQTEQDLDAAEVRWLSEVYQGDVTQLTVRAVVSGLVIGVVMCLSNLYIVLKTGWSIGATVTASVMAWALFALMRVAVAQTLGRVKALDALTRPFTAPYGLLENNATATVASAAGYMTGGGNMAALPALVMLTGVRPEASMMVFWFASIGILGVFAAIPIKRQLINRERLAFPTGTATAETLRALHAQGGAGARKAKILGLGSFVGALVAWARDAKAAWMPGNLPATFGFPFSLRGKPAVEWTLGIEGSVLMFGAGALMSFRTGWSMLLGAVLTYGFLAPAMFDQGVITDVGFKPIAGWMVWSGAAVLVSSGLVSFGFQWRSVLKSFSELALLLKPGTKAAEDPVAAVEVPQRWFPIGFLVMGPIVVFLCGFLFDIPWWAGVISLPLAVVMGIIAARVTGETDVTPTKALGPVTQLIYGGLLPQKLVPNLMGANVTGGVGLHAADLLTVLKTGYLVGAKPRLQLLAQVFGVLAGSAIVVPAFNLLVPDASALGSKEFPAPGAQVWAGVSKMLVQGFSSLHPTARWAALVGIAVGTLLAVLEAKLPKKAKAFLPSASGLGIAMVIPGYNSVMMFLGALAAELYRRKAGAQEGDDVTVPLSSGFVAGESLVGVAVKISVAFGLLPK